MAQQILSTNTFCEAKFLVDPDASQGGYTTISTALTAASSGSTIFIRPGTYTENLTLKAGVNLCAYDCDALTPNVIILGKCTYTGAGTVSISGIQLKTNSDFFLAVTGSAASIVNLRNCYLNVNNNTGISFTSSGAGNQINIENCYGETGTTGITYFTMTSTGTMFIQNCHFENSGNSVTNSTNSAGSVYINSSRFVCPGITTTSTGAIQIKNSDILVAAAGNTTMITHGGSASNSFIYNSFIGSGTASAVSIGSTLIMGGCVVDSSNTNAITGAGTLLNAGISFSNSSDTINTTTQTARTFRSGIFGSNVTGTTADSTYQSQIVGGQSWMWGLDNSDTDAYVLASSAALGTTNVMRVATTGEINYPLQSAFLATVTSNILDVTGDGTTYTIVYDNEVFDQNADFASGTYTAPITGRVQLSANASFNQIPVGSTSGNQAIVTSNRSLRIGLLSWGTVASGNQVTIAGSVLCDMDAADTATVQVTLTGSTKTADVNTTSWFSGIILA